ncbi:MAG: mraZ [Gammaproteobacteria bacterium]|nr:mraZ [Gammaproteobacteria bacterium]
MFRGINAINIDAKGRMAVPARYRERLVAKAAPQLVVTIDTEETCLLLYPLSEWEIIEQKLQGLPTFNKAARRIQRLLIGHATELELDGSNRILLPPLLREYAELDKRVMLIGQGKKFEIWDEQHWKVGRESWLDKETGDIDELPPELQSIAL